MKEYRAENGTVVTIKDNVLTCASLKELSLTLSNVTVKYIDDIRFVAKNSMYEFCPIVENGIIKCFLIEEI